MFKHKVSKTSTITLLPFLAVGAGLFSQTAAASEDFINKFWSGPVKFFECQLGLLNSTPIGLPRCMQASNVFEHQKMLNDIANANGGNRAAGLKGYDDSVDYIRSTLERAGYKVTLNIFPFNAFYPQGPGTLQVVDGAAYEFETDFAYLTQTEPGNVTGVIQAVDLQLGPDNASTSGCEADDFDGFTAGNIALVQRGLCGFGVKATNAAAAGATGIIVFNQGNSDDRLDVINGTLGDDYAGGIPAVFASYDVGVALSELDSAPVNLVVDVVREQTENFNVIAETKRGSSDNVIVVGAHLDSVFEGAGINDNGSGSAAVLELALQMKKARVKNKVRFAWWGAEEAGLVGSTQYVLGLTQEEKDKIKVYLNFDMISSPNFGYFIYDGDGSDFDLEGPAGSKATEKLFEDYFDLRGLPFEGTEISFRSDYAQFFEDGIAFGGLFTGAEDIKTAAQADKFGGTADEAYDSCYHQACDNLDNVNLEALEINADAMAYVTSWLSLSTKRLDKEIEAAAAASAPDARSALDVQGAGYDKDHWGNDWIK